MTHRIANASATLALLITAGSATAGTFSTITIDGDFSDWSGIPVLASDPADNAGSVDIADIQVANDGFNLYIRATYHTALAQSTFISIDIDSNTATGFDVFSLGLVGSEASWQNDFAFSQAAGVFNDGGGLSGDNFGGGHALMSPALDSSSREWSISLGATFASGGAAVFPDDSFGLLLWSDAGAGDASPAVPYTLAVPEPSAALLGGLGLMALLKRRRRNA